MSGKSVEQAAENSDAPFREVKIRGSAVSDEVIQKIGEAIDSGALDGAMRRRFGVQPLPNTPIAQRIHNGRIE